MSSRFLFAYKHLLYMIGAYASVIEIDDYIAIGYGESKAIGSLSTSQNEENQTSRTIKAIKASASNNIHVDYPIIISDTNSTEFKIIRISNESEFIEK